MVRRALNIFFPSERLIEPSPLTTRRVTPIDDSGACNVTASPSVTALPLIGENTRFNGRTSFGCFSGADHDRTKQ